MNLRDTFQRVFVVSLDRRRDRWEAFQQRLPADWPFAPPERVQAVDGQHIQPPTWWTAGRGAWGCYRSHLRLIEYCLNNQIDSVLLMEDDAVCCDGFADKAAEFITALPADWGMIYLGGQHLHANQHPPIKVNDHVYQPYNVNRTHAFALRGDMLQTVYSHLHKTHWQQGHHVDHHFGQLHQQRNHPIYVPREWLIGQAEGKSNISGREPPRRFWESAGSIASPHVPAVVAVVGPFRGGTSCVAGMLHKLGVSMGDRLKPPTRANPTGFFEAAQLARICRQSFREPWLTEQNTHAQRVARLRNWAAGRDGQLIGAKHPTLCMMVGDMVDAWPDLRLVVVDRPADESILSLRRQGWWTPKAREAVIPTMVETRDTALANCARPVLRLKHHDTLADPAATVDRLIQFLDLTPTDAEIAAAISHVIPNIERSDNALYFFSRLVSASRSPAMDCATVPRPSRAPRRLYGPPAHRGPQAPR